jgi:putative peptidoglycan lipid II flippase
VTVAGLGLLAVVARTVGPAALSGVVRSGVPAVLGAAAGALAGLGVAGALGADPVPAGVPAAVGVGVAAAGIVLVICAAVIMGTARGPLTSALRELRAPDAPVQDPEEVHRD